MFKLTFRIALAASAAAFFAAGSALAQFAAVPGRDYTPIQPSQPLSGDATVEILEFFAYGCIHCFHLEPQVEKWKASLPRDTKFTKVPTLGALRGVNSAPLYYTLEAMGLLDKLHYKIYEALHNDNVVLGNPEVRNQWLSKHGVDIKRFQEMEQSFSVQNKIRRAGEMFVNYRIETTPTFAVNGKYAVPNHRNTDMTFRIVDSLAATERAAAQTKPAPAKAAPAPAKTSAPATK